MKKATGKLFLLLLIVIEIFSACSAGGGGPDWDENILVYATLNPDRVDQEAVDRFNRAHADVQIEVRSYYDEEDPSGKNGRERLVTEIMAGKIPDILDMSGYSDPLPYQQLAQKGYLENLWPWIENDPDLGQESLMEPPLKAAEVDGGLYMVFRTVYINTLVGAESLVGSNYSWTMEDLRSAFAKMPEDSTITDFYADQKTMFDLICRMKLDSYVDWASGQCSFDSPDFRGTLEFVKSFPAETEKIDPNSANYQEQVMELRRRRMNGLQMLSMTTVSSIEDVQINDLIYGGRTTFVGYPVEDGSVGSSFELSGVRLALSSTCRNKEAAWEFLRQLFLPRFDYNSMDEIDEVLRQGGFPINRADYMLMRRLRMKFGTDTFHYTVNGEPLPPLSEEEVQRFEDLYNQIEKIDLCDSNIYDIVWEQAQPYFAGDKTLDETVDLIQRRVTLYVNEAR